MDQEACLSVEYDEDGSSSSIMSAGAYLKQLREERNMCADVVTARPTIVESTKKQKWSGVKGLNLVEEKVPTKDFLIPQKEWQDYKSADFAEKRRRVQETRGKVKIIKMRTPRNSDDVGWHEFILEKCVPQAQSLLPQFPNHNGTPPALSVVCALPSGLVNELITYLVEWSESEGLTRPIREWIYSLLLIVEFPLLPDVGSALRDLAKNAKRARSCLSDDRIDEANEFSMFIAIVSHFFNQKDLSD